MAGWIAINAQEKIHDPRAAGLKAQGWAEQTQAPCPELQRGRFYETSAGEESAELYVSLAGETLAKESSWPDEPRICREIFEPSNIEELL